MAATEEGKEPLNQKYFWAYIERFEMFSNLWLHIHEQTVKYPPANPNKMFLEAEHLPEKFIAYDKIREDLECF